MPPAESREKPQYLQYLDRTLAKSEQTDSIVRGLLEQVKILEYRQEQVESLKTNQSDVYERLRQLEDLQNSQMEQDNLTKLIMDQMSAKITDLEHAQGRNQSTGGGMNRQDIDLLR